MAYESQLIRVYFVELDIANDPLRVNGSGQPLQWNSQTWLGVGALGSISGLGESTEMAAAQITLTISGIPNSRINDLRVNQYQERVARVWYNDLNSNYSVVNSQLIWAGKMDTAQVEIGDTATIQMQCESALIRWNRPAPRRMNDQQQQILYPGDRGLQYVAALKNVQLEL